jgi:L-iditol 2-dehydrogenase
VRVVRLHARGDLRMADESAPVPSPGESLVRVTAVGICGSDLHWFGEGGIGDAQLTQPLVLGHELAGVIQGGPRDGQRVAIDPAIPCLSCPTCLSGDRNLCPSVRFAGHAMTDGGLRDLLAWPSQLLHRLPDELSAPDGAMLEPLGVAIHAVDLSHLRVGMSVGVVGCGPIGLLILQVARLAGATSVVAVDPLSHRRAKAASLGADLTLAPEEARSDDLADLDVTFDASGTDDAIASAIQLARPGARVILAGIPDAARTTFPAGDARRKGLTLVMVRRMKEVYPRAIRMVQTGAIDVASLVSARYPLSDATEAFTAAAARTGLKVMLEPNN